MNSTRRFKLTGTIALAMLAAGLNVHTARAAQQTCGFNVTSSFIDNDSNNVPFQLQSDGSGSYVAYTNSRTDSVASEIQGNSCDWVLALGGSQSRAVRLTLAYPASNGATAPFIGPQNIAPRIISKCGLNSGNNGLTYGTMTVTGQTLECGFSAIFDYAGNTYAVRLEPNNFPGTTWVQVTCVGASSLQCNTWTVLPLPNGVKNTTTNQNAAVGEVVQITTSKGKTVTTPLGLYYVAFSVLITKP